MAALQFFRRLSSTVSRRFKEEELKQLCKVKPPMGAYLPGSDTGVQLGGKRVVVLMVGWAQSRQNALSKYAAIYTALGLPCVAMAPEIKLIWFTG